MTGRLDLFCDAVDATLPLGSVGFERETRGIDLAAFCLAAIATFVSLPALAQTQSQLSEWCQSPTNSTPELTCKSYIRGWYDSLLWQYISKTKNDALDICLLHNSNLQQVRQIVEQFFRDHSETSSQDAWISVGAALRQEFPCQPK
jgi:hypothetical protein